MAEFETKAAKPKTPEIKPEYKEVLNKIRGLYTEAGGELRHKPEDYGLNKYHKSKKGLEVIFDYGVPEQLYTPDGSLTILGSHAIGDTKKFWSELNKAYDVEIIKPQRDDAEVRKRSEFEYQTSYSGPLIRIKEKQE